jgi:hypothetical protein
MAAAPNRAAAIGFPAFRNIVNGRVLIRGGAAERWVAAEE